VAVANSRSRVVIVSVPTPPDSTCARCSFSARCLSLPNITSAPNSCIRKSGCNALGRDRIPDIAAGENCVVMHSVSCWLKQGRPAGASWRYLGDS
jgi:hypothetical protein